LSPLGRVSSSPSARSVPIALTIKRLHIQNPKVPAQLFDLVAAPTHDNFDGPNVITTFGAVHSVTPERLAEAGKSFAPRARAKPSALPRGCDRLRRQARNAGARDRRFAPRHAVARRTRADSLAELSRAIDGAAHFVWDSTGDNPYFALLSLADAIVATEDSVNMVTQAAGTGKPVYVQSLPGRRSSSPASTR